jgi:hypothetical protein
MLPTIMIPDDTVLAQECVVWQSMDTSPKEGYPVQHVQLLMPDGSIVPDAHWAYGGGEEQPAFGPAWFRPFLRPDGSVSSYYEVTGKPQAWAPLKL